MSKYNAGNSGKKLTGMKGLSLSGHSLCISCCNTQDNVLEQMTLYGEAKPHEGNYCFDAFLNTSYKLS